MSKRAKTTREGRGRKPTDGTLFCGLVMPIGAMGSYSVEHWASVKSILTKSIDAIAAPRFEARLVSMADERKARVIAGISVKSTKPHHFDRRVREIYVTLRPALSMVTLVLECRSAFRSLPILEGKSR